MSYRILQINELIRHELSQLLVNEIEFPKGCLVTIIRVETSRDLRHAKIWISILPEGYTQKVLERLKREIGRLQFALNKKLTMKPLPRIRFVVDETEKKASDIETLLNKIKAEQDA